MAYDQPVASQHEAEIGGDLDRKGRGSVHRQFAEPHPKKQRSQRRRKPARPMPRQNTVGADDTVLDARRSDADAGKEVNGIKQRPALSRPSR